MGPNKVRTKNLILTVEREGAAHDVLALYEDNREFEIFEPTRPKDFYTYTYHVRCLHREYNAYLKGSFLRYYIHPANAKDLIIGSVNFNIFTEQDSLCAEMGYKVDSHFQNRGVAFEACLAGIKIMRQHYDIKRIFLHIHPDNLPSLRVADKLGCKLICVDRDYAHVNGRYVDLLRYSLDTSAIQ